MTFRSPTFQGGTDAATAENWMLSIEKYLCSIGCTDSRQVRLSTFLFRGDPRDGGRLSARGLGIDSPYGLSFNKYLAMLIVQHGSRSRRFMSSSSWCKVPTQQPSTRQSLQPHHDMPRSWCLLKLRRLSNFREDCVPIFFVVDSVIQNCIDNYIITIIF